MNFQIRETCESDCLGLAELYEKSGPTGTGCISPQTGYTLDYIKSIMRQNASLLLYDYVAEENGKIVGHVSAYRVPGEPDAVHMGDWVVDSKYQGAVISFRLGYVVYKRVCKEGYTKIYYQTLVADNRPAKIYEALGAIPAPKPSIQMGLNMLVDYAPKIVNDHFYKAYFTSRDYQDSWVEEFRESCLMRPGTEDPYLRWEDKKAYICANQVFPFKIERDNNLFTGAIDLWGERYNYINTKDFSVLLRLSTDQISIGDQVKFDLIFTNKRVEPQEIQLMFDLPDEQVKVERVVGDVFEFSKEYSIESGLILGKDYLNFDCMLQIGGYTLELGVSAKVVQPFTVQVDRLCSMQNNGAENFITLQIKNNLNIQVNGKIQINLNENTYVSDFTLDRQMIEDVKVQIDDLGFSGIAELQYNVSYVINEMVDLISSGYCIVYKRDEIGLVYQEIANNIILVNQSFWLFLDKKTGRISLYNYNYESIATSYCQFNQKSGIVFERYEVISRNGIYFIKLWYKLERNELIREIQVSGSPVMKEKWTCLSGDDAVDLRWYFNNHWLGGQIHFYSTRYTSPIETDYTYPKFTERTRLMDEDFVEKWICYTNKDHLAGVIWEKPIDQAQFNTNLPQLNFRLQQQETQTLHILCGELPLEYIQKYYQTNYMPEVPFVDQKLSPVLVSTGQNEIHLDLKLPLEHCLEPYELLLQMPEGWQCSTEKVSNGEKLQFSVGVDMPDFAAYGTMHFVNDLTDKQMQVPLIQIQDKSKQVSRTVETVKNREVLRLDNGRFELAICPELGGMAYSLVYQGKNQLCADFPVEQPTIMFKEWVGGLYPVVSKFYTNTEYAFFGHDLRIAIDRAFRWEEVNVSHGGLNWEGYKLTGVTDRLDFKLELDIEYLTVPGSNVMAIRTTYKNPNQVQVRFNGLVNCFLKVDEDFKNEVLVVPRPNGEYIRKRSKFCGRILSTRWMAVEDAETGTFVMLVNTARSSLVGNEFGFDGVHLAREQRITLPPLGEQTFIDYLIVGKDLQKNMACSELAKYRLCEEE